MSKLYRQPIKALVKNGRPVAFRWRGQWFFVAICMVHDYLPRWMEWWDTVGLPRYRCETRQGMVCDLVLGKTGWMLERIWDWYFTIKYYILSKSRIQ